MTLKQWIKNQKVFESNATKGRWRSDSIGILTGWIINDQPELMEGGSLYGPLFNEISGSLSKFDTDFIRESRNNYRNVLEALEIAVSALSGEELAIKEIKNKLGVE